MKTIPKRQQIRMALLILSLLVFPITMNYLSPYIILYGASQGIVNGSLIMFGLLFTSSLVFGRLLCSWICPADGLGEICMLSIDQPIKGKWLNAVKWVIWVIWLGLIAYMAFSAGGYKSVNFFLLTESRISVDESAKYMIYLIVVGVFVFLPSHWGTKQAVTLYAGWRLS